MDTENNNQQIYRLDCRSNGGRFSDIVKFHTWWNPARAWLIGHCGQPSRSFGEDFRWAYTQYMSSVALYLTMRDRDLFLLLFDDFGITYESVTMQVIHRSVAGIEHAVPLTVTKPL